MGLRLPEPLRYELRAKWERIQDRWRRLSLRRRINENPKLIITITCVSVFLLVVTVIVHLGSWQSERVKPGEKGWYYDLNTGKLFIADKELVAPIEAPSGALPNGEAAGVRAYVLTYAFEPNDSERFIGFLEKANPDAESGGNPAQIDAGGAGRWGHGKLIRRVEDEEWVPGDSIEGREILEEAFIPDENGERPHYVRPE